ncbi:MAG: peptidoglycan endopeptidase [Nevskiaceae bacterium]|nr:MAG: peptidoglycan endopeptidase [Nevskiaceae bacterium]
MDVRLAAAMGEAAGKPYEWGAEGQGAFDCSGLIYWMRGRLGLANGPRTASGQYRRLARYARFGERGDWGDLVFRFAPERGVEPYHVAIVAGPGSSSEKRRVFDAPSSGKLVGYREIAIRPSDAIVSKGAAWI